MLCEDDAFVRNPEAINQMFQLIERNEVDVIGGPRATGSNEVLDFTRERFGDWIDTTSWESGPILWPCFLFAKRSDLLKTDGRFGAWGWKAGEEILGRTYATDQAMDTFGWATLQLRDMGLRFHIVGNYRVQREQLAYWSSNAPWFHVGGLSVKDVMNDGLRDVVLSDPYDWSKRVSWWTRVLEKWDNALPMHHEAAMNLLSRYTVLLDPTEIAQWKEGFDCLITWNETQTL